jgi:hypothetical protein
MPSATRRKIADMDLPSPARCQAPLAASRSDCVAALADRRERLAAVAEQPCGAIARVAQVGRERIRAAADSLPFRRDGATTPVAAASFQMDARRHFAEPPPATTAHTRAFRRATAGGTSAQAARRRRSHVHVTLAPPPTGGPVRLRLERAADRKQSRRRCARDDGVAGGVDRDRAISRYVAEKRDVGPKVVPIDTDSDNRSDTSRAEADASSGLRKSASSYQVARDGVEPPTP